MTDETTTEAGTTIEPDPDSTATQATPPVRRCPKDGTAMEARGRRRGAWRCPECGGMFIDGALIRGYRRRVPAWAPVVMSVLASLLATLIVRRLRRPPGPRASSVSACPYRQ